MTMAGMLHSPTNLFAAHRYFIWVYEKALREECGYEGFQPVSFFSLLILFWVDREKGRSEKGG